MSMAEMAGDAESALTMENGRRPPFWGAIWVAFAESVPSVLTSKTARKPGVGGTPLTEATRLLPSSENTIWLTVPAGPVAGVVWLRPSERRVLLMATRPSFWSTL